MTTEIKPVAWRYEVRGNNADGRPTTEWREYGTYSTQTQAESHLAYCGNGIDGRVVPLVRAKDAINAIEEQSMVAVRLACAIDHIREALSGGNVEDLMYVINAALAEYHKKVPA